MHAMTEREVSRHLFRQALFTRRGAANAEALADRLLSRDRDLDTRRMCVECEHFITAPRHTGDECFAANQGWLGPVGRFFSPLRDTLQRCTSFSFQKP